MKQVAKKSTTLAPQAATQKPAAAPKTVERVQQLNGFVQPQNGHLGGTSSLKDATTNGVTSLHNGPSAPQTDYEITIVDDDDCSDTNFHSAATNEPASSRLKRSLSNNEQSQNKKSRVDSSAMVATAAGANRKPVSRKMLDECVLACINDYKKKFLGPDITVLMQKIKELEESREKWKKKAVDLQKKTHELGNRCTSIQQQQRVATNNNLTAVNQHSAPSTPVKTNYPTIMRSLSTATSQPTASLPSPVRLLAAGMTQQTPLANVAAVLRPRAMVVGANVTPATSGAVAAASSMTIDLTDDDDTLQQQQPSQTVAGLPLRSLAAQLNRALPLMFNTAATGLPASTASTAVVKPLTRTAAPPTDMRPPQLPALVYNGQQPSRLHLSRHPAPLPLVGPQRGPSSAKLVPPKPTLKLSRVAQGIVLSWNMATTDAHENATQYQLYAYQETHESPKPSLWKKVGSVDALPLPMACTLTQFQIGNRYHFAVRAVDAHGRLGPFSEPGSIHLEALAVS